MQPIQELLARLRWDSRFAGRRVVLAYWDRVARALVRANLREMQRDAVNPSLLDFVDADGVAHSVPLHRIREVWCDGESIWRRPQAGQHPPDSVLD